MRDRKVTQRYILTRVATRDFRSFQNFGSLWPGGRLTNPNRLPKFSKFRKSFVNPARNKGGNLS